MALLHSLIHSDMALEPAGFHPGSPDLISFSVNLSLECPSDGQPGDDENAAEQRFQSFLTDVQKVEFHVWSIASTDPKFTYVGKIAGKISDPDAGAVADLMKWLRGEHTKVKAPRYWSTTRSVQAGQETVTVAEAAGAGDRLRAAEAWNAPVGHRFSLTHVLHVPLDKVTEYYLVLPYFGDPGAAPDLPTSAGAIGDASWDIAYDAKGQLQTVYCRTDLLKKDGTIGLDPSKVDPMLTPEGYLIVDPDADNLRRVTRWFEDRAGSLMAAAPAFAERPDEDAKSPYGRIFMPTLDDAGKGKLNFSAPGAAWRIVASLCGALDSLLIGMLKPSHDDTSEAKELARDANEGEILAPLVTAVLQALETAVPEAPDLDPKLHDARTVTRALRAVIQQSPLAERTPQPGALVAALRQVHGIELPDPSKKKPTIAERYLDLLLGFHVGYPAKPELEVADAGLKAGIEGDELRILSRIVADADQRLHDEAGVENAILRVIETSGPVEKLPEQFAVEVLKLITGSKPPQLSIEAAFASGWNEYKSVLEGTFNGAEATRRASGSDFTGALLAHAASHPPVPNDSDVLPGSSVHAGRLIRQADFYGRRWFDDLPNPDPGPGCFDALAKRSLAAPTFPGTTEEKAVVWAHLAAAYATALAPLDTVLDPAARFIPDAAPQPLPIQIAANINGANVDEFAKHLNGIAVAVRRIDSDDGTDPWAHANLARLTWDADDAAAGQPEVVDALHPMLPAVSGGRGPMFIDYEGFPFASSELDSTRIADAAQTGPDYLPFYRHGSTSAAGFEPVPRLAYGRRFESFAFVTSNAGTLPPDLQAAPHTPWKPRGPITPPAAKDAKLKLIAETDYSRRTAIGQMAMIEAPADTAARRVGAPITAVMPLAGDYPRVGLFAEPQADGVRDIFREPDGDGTLVIRNLNTPATTERARLTGIRFAGKPQGLSLRLFDGAASGPDAPGVAAFSFPQMKGGVAVEEKNAVDLMEVRAIDILIETTRSVEEDPESSLNVRVWVTCGSATPDPLSFVTRSNSLWLRVVLEAEGSSAQMSFAEPETGRPAGGPLLLLAPKPVAPKPDPWKRDLNQSVKLTLGTPRVGYLDFERWIANGRLRRELFKTDEEPEGEKPSNETLARRLERALLAAYVMRHLDERIAAALDRLPDPAVERVRIELSVLDQLVPGEATSIAEEVDLGGALIGVAEKAIREEPAFWTPALLRGLFDRIEARFSFSIELAPAEAGQPGLTPSGTGWVATVPAGMVVHLATHALVAEEHFKRGAHPPVFHPELLQYAPRRVAARHVAFPSASIRVETMLDAVTALKAEAPGLADTIVSVRPVPNSRRYDIVANQQGLERLADDKLTELWRLIGEIDVISQRWRPSGRPIYHHVRPKQFRADGKTWPVRDPALPVRLPDKEKNALTLFEAEAFFDRPDFDAQTATQKLQPLPGPTVLQQHFWDAPSATWFRHRFILRSRYAGALRNLADREAQAWPSKPATSAHAWTMRVAMLAELSRILLTRPQLRALIPLTTAPGADDAKRAAPPVLTVLQEPPFARGGLADRISAEIKTGFGYGFAAAGNPVEILDSRKEIGPTPYLDYRPMEATTALGMTLMTEGPIGLTFDQVNASAPAFPNSLLTLSPIGVAVDDPLAGRPLEEHFLGVSLRRHIDPEWITDHVAPNLNLDAEQCWWIDAKLGQKQTELLSFAVHGAETIPLLWINDERDKLDKDAFVVRTSKAVVDGGMEGTTEPSVKIARLRRTLCEAISILHQPVAPGRYSTSVLAIPAKADWVSTVAGRSNVPLVLASIEWSPKPKRDATGAVKGTPVTVTLVAPEGSEPRATIASAPTFLAWTRTGRDFDFVHVAEQRQIDGANNVLEGEQTRVTQLVAMLTSDHKAILLKRSGTDGRAAWLTSSTFLSDYPLHVHRHLAVLTTRYLDLPGRPIETFCRSAVLSGAATVLTDPTIESESIKEKTKEELEGGDPDDYPAEDCVRVVEFETPAAILCATNPAGIPPTYQKAYFDLIATGFKPGKGKGALRLLLRCVGSAAHLRAFKSLSISLANVGEDPRKLEVELDNDADDFTKAVDLRIETTAMNPTVRLIRGSGRTKDGRFTLSTEPFTIAPPDDARPGFFMTLEAKGGSGELWADASLLHSQAGAFTGAFDFNWLFTAGSGAEPAIDVAPKGLHQMVEAQARIVTVSPPIPIVAHNEPPPELVGKAPSAFFQEQRIRQSPA